MHHLLQEIRCNKNRVRSSEQNSDMVSLEAGRPAMNRGSEEAMLLGEPKTVQRQEKCPEPDSEALQLFVSS